MAVIGWEFLVIAGILIVLLVWGPGQIPKIARSVGLARKELEDMKKAVEPEP